MAQNPPPVQVVIAAEDRTRAAIESAKAGLEGLQGSVGNLKAVFAGLAASLAGLTVVGQFKSFVEAAANMDDLAEKTGASVEKLSALAGVAKISGVSLDTVESALVRLAKGLAGADEESKGAGNALAALGLKAEELKKLDTADALKIVADRLAEYKDGAGKTALAIDLLGKSGAQALPYLKDLAETQNLQARLTAEQAAQAENLEKNLKRLQASTSGAWKEFSAAILPVVDSFVKALLQAQNETSGLRDSVKKLSQDGTILEWAENAAVAVAYLVDSVKLVINTFNVLKETMPALAAGVERMATNFGLAFDRRTDPAIKALIQARGLRKELEAEERAGAATAKLLSESSFADRVRAQFEMQRNVAAGLAAGADLGGRPGKKALDYSSNVDKDKDALKEVLGYVEQIREQLVGATEGEFERMREKASAVFAKIDWGKLSPGNKDRFAGLFAQVTEDIDTLEERARAAQWGKALAEQAKIAQDAVDRADESFAQFNEAMSRQAQDMEFEISLVGKLASERQKLAAIRKIDLDAQRAQAAIPEGAANRDERIADISARAAEAKARVSELSDTLREKGRDGWVGLTSAAADYFDRVTNDAENMRTLLTDAFRGIEDAFVKFATTGKLSFKDLANSIVADLARIAVRQNITGPLAEGLKGATGSGGLGGLFGSLLDNILNRGGVAGQGNGPGGVWSGLDSLDLPSFAVGTDYVPRDMIARIHQGERIVPASENRAGASGVTIVQHISIDSRSDQASIRQAMAAAKEQAKAEILDSMNRGGAFAR